ncbi:cupin domain-containing protein [Aerococcaceae bacterium DSM 111020]|nr:cupin domain-containing protein [Aerococcaceae bacterium DSM 111020]
MQAAEWIEYYELLPHPEGGYFKQVAKSSDILQEERKERARYTSIYFLLTDDNPSRFHRLTADEIWYFHAGAPLTVHMISPEGDYQTVKIGANPQQDEQLQFTVPAGYIFGSTVDTPDAYALVSCMVAPGFEFEDFELFHREDLLAQYPDHQEIITRLTK